ANGSIDGFILSLSKETQAKADFHHISEVINQGMPVVMFDRVTNKIQCDKVIIDDQKAAFSAVETLIGKRRRNIAIISTVDYVSVGKLRTEGYLQALEQYKLPVREEFILKVEDMDSCEEAISRLLEDRAIDAVFAVNELFAVTAIKVAGRLGIRVPEDLCVIAFTDGIISKISTPTITTVSQNGIQMGRKAAQILIQRIEQESDEEEVFHTEVIETHLIERESTK